MKKHIAPTEPAEADIQHAAYYLWIESGRAPGHDLENWLTARELLRHKAAGKPHSATPLRPVQFPPHNLGPSNPPFAN
jgi:hypothetical protein